MHSTPGTDEALVKHVVSLAPNPPFLGYCDCGWRARAVSYADLARLARGHAPSVEHALPAGPFALERRLCEYETPFPALGELIAAGPAWYYIWHEPSPAFRRWFTKTKEEAIDSDMAVHITGNSGSLLSVARALLWTGKRPSVVWDEYYVVATRP